MADLMKALRNAHAAGDTDAARRIAAMIKSQGESDPAQESELINQSERRESRVGYGGDDALVRAKKAFTGEESMTQEIAGLQEIGGAPELNAMSVPAFKASLGLLTTGETEPLKAILKQQMGDQVDFSQDEKGNTIAHLPSGMYALNKPGFSPQDMARAAFDVLSFAPAGRAATIGGAGVKSGLTEAAIEAGEAGVGGEFTPTDIAEAAALGGAFKGAENALGSGYRALTGSPSDEVAQVREFAKERNLPLMTSDIVEPETFVGKSARSAGEKVPFAGTGLPRAEQQKARGRLVDEYAKSFGDYNPDEVYQSLKNQKNKIKKAAGERRGNIVSQVEDVVAVDSVLSVIDDEIARLSKSPSGAVRKTADMETVSKLNDFKEDLIGDMSFANLEQLRTIFREGVKGERQIMPTRSDASLNKIYAAMTKDMDSAIKDNLGDDQLRRWKQANAIFADEAKKVKKTRLKGVLEKGELTPEVVNNLLFSQKPSEVKSIFNSLDVTGKRAARSALIGKAFEKSSGSPDRFLNELNRLSKSTGIAFKGKERKELEGLKAYLDSTRQASRAGVQTETGQQLFQIAVPSAIASDVATTGGAGTAGAVAYGLLARAYESTPVRNAMARLASAPKGSTKFEKALKELSSMLNSVSQSQRDEGQ